MGGVPRRSDRPGVLRRRALLRTGLATFAASGSSNVRRVGNPKAYDPSIKAGGSSAGPRTPAVGRGVSFVHWFGSHRCRLSAGSPDHVSALSRPGTRPGIRPVTTTICRRALIDSSWFPVAFRPPAFAFWSSCARPGVGPSSRSAYRPTAGPRRGFHVSHARAAIGVGALSTPGTVVLILTGVAHRPAPAASQPLVPEPRHNIHRCEAPLDEASTKGSRVFTRPIFPSPVATGWNGSASGFPPSFAPRDHS
jgi:hypothetical protein